MSTKFSLLENNHKKVLKEFLNYPSDLSKGVNRNPVEEKVTGISNFL